MATRLSRTPSSTGNRKTWTFSAWIKRTGNISGTNTQNILHAGNYSIIRLENENLEYLDYDGSSTALKNTSAKLRDINAWYHIVVSADFTQASADNRVKFYINGEQVTSFGTNNVKAQNYDTKFNLSGTSMNIGADGNNSSPFDGLMSHIHFIDGTAYDASAFGETDSTTGEWKINTSPSVSYGTNGFFILKDGNSVTDQSGNGNNLTVGGGTLTKSEDCPSNVFTTMNPLNHDYANTDSQFQNGSTYVLPQSNGSLNYAVSSLGMPKGNGKFYAETKLITNDTVTAGVGIVDMDYVSEIFYQNRNLPEQTNSTYIGRVIYLSNGYSIIPSTENNSYGSSYANGDIIQIACDMENGSIYFGKNGTWQNSGDPTSGASKTGAIDISSQSWYTETTHWGFWCGDKSTSGYDKFAWNFGNGYFQSTAVSSAGTNASGIGIFEYDVPTGYTALSTKGLNE